VLSDDEDDYCHQGRSMAKPGIQDEDKYSISDDDGQFERVKISRSPSLSTYIGMLFYTIFDTYESYILFKKATYIFQYMFFMYLIFLMPFLYN